MNVSVCFYIYRCCLAVKNSKRSLQSIGDGGTSRFLEYWIPVQISFHQLEQYCDALLSNSIHLCSCEKRDTNGALQETLQRVRKVRLVSSYQLFYYIYSWTRISSICTSLVNCLLSYGMVCFLYDAYTEKLAYVSVRVLRFMWVYMN